MGARAPSKAELALARRSDVCGAALRSADARSSLASAAGGPGTPSQSTIVRNQRESNSGSDDGAGRAIAAGLSSAVERATNPVVIALLFLAMLMFGVAALPRGAVATRG